MQGTLHDEGAAGVDVGLSMGRKPLPPRPWGAGREDGPELS